MFIMLDVWEKSAITKKAKRWKYFINLTGLTRFKIKEEISNEKLYREFEVDYEKFNS